MGRPIYWFTITPLQGAEEGTDRWAIEQRLGLNHPLRLDLTDEKDLAHALALHHTHPSVLKRRAAHKKAKLSAHVRNKKAGTERPEGRPINET